MKKEGHCQVESLLNKSYDGTKKPHSALVKCEKVKPGRGFSATKQGKSVLQ